MLSIINIIPCTEDGRIWVWSIGTVGENQNARKKFMSQCCHFTHLGMDVSNLITKLKHFFFFYSPSLGSPLCPISRITFWLWIRQVSYYTNTTNAENRRTSIHDPSVRTVDGSECLRTATARQMWKQFRYLKDNSSSHCSSKSFQGKRARHTEGTDGHV